MPERLNRRDIARALGVSQPTIDAWQREGMPCHKRGARGRAYDFDTEDCRAWVLTRPASLNGSRARANRSAANTQAERLCELAEAFVMSLGGPVGTENAAKLGAGFSWSWSDVAEAIAWHLPFANAGDPDGGSGWTFPVPHTLHWLGDMLAMLGRYGLHVDVPKLPSALRGLRVRAGLPLCVPSGFRPLEELIAEGRGEPWTAVPVLPEAVGLNPATEEDRLDAARADLAELDLQKKRGELVPAADPDHGVVALATTTSGRLQGVGSQIAQELSTETTPDRCQEIVDAAIAEALHDLANGAEAELRIKQAERTP